MRTEIIEELKKAGAVAVGFAKAGPVEHNAAECFSNWIKRGHHAGMTYMENYPEIRRNPQLLLEGAQSVISIAFSFAPSRFRDNKAGMIACYAYGDDYHDTIRKRLSGVVTNMKNNYGGEYRICIDSAPILERYWAVRSGIASIGKNGLAIVDGFGSMLFLAEIVTTLQFEEHQCSPWIKPGGDTGKCNGCGLCKKACPAGAIMDDSTVNAKRCLSYLTIEHRGEWTEPEATEATASPIGRNTIFGCDLCLRSCPLNHNASPSEIREFHPRSEIMSLTKEDIAGMKQQDFSRIFKGSPIKRAKLAGLKRNIGAKLQ